MEDLLFSTLQVGHQWHLKASDSFFREKSLCRASFLFCFSNCGYRAASGLPPSEACPWAADEQEAKPDTDIIR